MEPVFPAEDLVDPFTFSGTVWCKTRNSFGALALRALPQSGLHSSLFFPGSISEYHCLYFSVIFVLSLV